jgi:hypothetical protein
MPLSTIFQLYHGGEFISGGNRSTWGKPPTCRKLLTNFITQCCIEYTSPWAGLEITRLKVIGTDCTGSCKSSYYIYHNDHDGTRTIHYTKMWIWIILIIMVVSSPIIKPCLMFCEKSFVISVNSILQNFVKDNDCYR